MEEEKKAHEHHESEHHEHHSKKNLTEKIRENPWIIATFVFGILSVVLLLTTFFGGVTGNAISANSAGEKLLQFFTNMGYDGLTLNSVKEFSGVYEASLTYEGKTSPIYITKDGKYLGSLSPLDPISDSTNTPTEVPKSDKPEVELYVFTYCPYGTQMEKAMIPAIKLLGDKINFKIRQIGAMHDPQGCSGSACFEKTEAERQLCIEKEYPTKFLDYVLAFAESTEIGACKGDATCLVPKLNALYTQFGIDATKINSCMNTDGETLYNAEVNNAGGKGSPAVIINGVEVQDFPRLIDRNPEKVKGVICNTFNKVPSECSTALGTSSPSAGFGKDTTSSTSAASC